MHERTTHSLLRAPWVLTATLALAAPAALAVCGPSPRFAVEMSVQACEAISAQTLRVDARIHAEVRFSPFLENCPRAEPVTYGAGSEPARSYLYSIQPDSGIAGCEDLAGGKRRWMLSKQFCCDTEPPSQACREGWQRLEDLSGSYLAYLADEELIPRPDTPVCSADSRALEMVIAGCTMDDTQTAILEATVERYVDFRPLPYNCPLPEIAEVAPEARRTERFVAARARACAGFAAGSRLWMWSVAPCCDEGSTSVPCREGAPAVVEATLNPVINRFLLEKGYREPDTH